MSSIPGQCWSFYLHTKHLRIKRKRISKLILKCVETEMCSTSKWKWGRIRAADQCESFCRGTWYIIPSLMWTLSSPSWWTGFPTLKGSALASHVFRRSLGEKLPPDTWTWNANWPSRGVDIFTAFCTWCNTSLSLHPSTLQITMAAQTESIHNLNYPSHVIACISTCGGGGYYPYVPLLCQGRKMLEDHSEWKSRVNSYPTPPGGN